MTTNHIIHDTRTQAERDYDAQRDGSAYRKPQPAEASTLTVREILALPLDHPIHLRAAERLDAMLAAEAAAAAADPLTAIFEAIEDEDAIASWVDQQPQIVVTHLYNQNGDVTREPTGSLAATSYRSGAVEVEFPADGFPPQVYACGSDSIDLREMMRALPHLNALLNDPRVRAALGA